MGKQTCNDSTDWLEVDENAQDVAAAERSNFGKAIAKSSSVGHSTALTLLKKQAWHYLYTKR